MIVNTLWKDFWNIFLCLSISWHWIDYHNMLWLSTQNTIFLKKYFYPILSYICSIIFCSNSPDPKQNICLIFGKMGKNRGFEIGGTKNQNKCSVFRAAYKLLHLHTNLIFKHSIQNLQNPTKSSLFNQSNPKI